MKKLLLYSASLLLFLSANAQYSTPGTGVIWNMDSLVLHSNGVVLNPSTDIYQITADLEISESDTLDLFAAITVNLDADVTVTVRGSFFADFFTDVIFTATNQDEPYRGFRFESTAEANFQNTIFSYGGGLKVITPDFIMQFCTIHHNDLILNTGATIEVSNGKPLIFNSSFIDNKGAAISSAASAEVAPVIFQNIFQGNNTGNSNRPQINLGPSGSDTTLIIENTITGNPSLDQVGGIAFSSLLGGEANVIIYANEVKDNRYGIAIIGNNISAYIGGNTITDNNTQGEPLLGGSGINLNSTSESFAELTANTIEGNLWGVTIQGSFMVNMGDDNIEHPSPGLNSFDNNGNSGEIYALYNNTPNPVSALNNCWISSEDITLEQAEAVVFDQSDDPTLGVVSIDPFWNCGFVDGIAEQDLNNLITLYPNPASDIVNLNVSSGISIEKIRVLNLAGQEVYVLKNANSPTLSIDLNPLVIGVYIVEIQSDKGIIRKRLIKQ
jgi:hypothetical protein